MAGMSSEDVVIVPYRDGPYLVRGPLVLRDQDGRPIDLTRRTIALCRCGKSRMRPFCDGTHRLIQFRAPSQPERPWAEPLEAAGERAPGRRSEPRPADGGPSLALTGLRRARERVIGLLEGPGAAHRHPAIEAALQLIDGACRLLEAPASAERAALHLVKGGFDALGEAAASPDPGVGAAAADLAAVAVALEPRCNGTCPS